MNTLKLKCLKFNLSRAQGKMTKLRMKCPHCRCWNSIEVDKIFVPQPSAEPKGKVLIPTYKPLKTEKCKKCGKVIAEPKELIRISAR